MPCPRGGRCGSCIVGAGYIRPATLLVLTSNRKASGGQRDQGERRGSPRPLWNPLTPSPAGDTPDPLRITLASPPQRGGVTEGDGGVTPHPLRGSSPLRRGAKRGIPGSRGLPLVREGGKEDPRRPRGTGAGSPWSPWPPEAPLLLVITSKSTPRPCSHTPFVL